MRTLYGLCKVPLRSFVFGMAVAPTPFTREERFTTAARQAPSGPEANPTQNQTEFTWRLQGPLLRFLAPQGH